MEMRFGVIQGQSTRSAPFACFPSQAAAVIAGGERSWIPAAVSRSMIFISFTWPRRRFRSPRGRAGVARARRTSVRESGKDRGFVRCAGRMFARHKEGASDRDRTERLIGPIMRLPEMFIVFHRPVRSSSSASRGIRGLNSRPLVRQGQQRPC